MPPNYESLLENGDYWEAEVKPPLHVTVPTKPRKSLSISSKWSPRLNLLSGGSLTKRPQKPANQTRTAYLDGLRGFAAFLVYWMHHQLWARGSLKIGGIFENGFGYDNNYYFASFPFIRTFFTGGHFAVTVFFVISGYVLSAKPLSLIHSCELTKLGDNLSSALFRRWLRLFIPVIITTYLYMTCWHLFGIWTDSTHMSNYRDEIWNWYVELKNFSFVFRVGGEPWFTYNYHTWSIPVEFRGSVVVYTALLSVSRCTRNARLWVEVGLIAYFMYIVDGSFCAMFMAGMLLCDLDLLAANNNLPQFFYRLESFKELIFYNLLVISIYLGGVPSHVSDIATLKSSPGWYYLSFLKPQAVFDFKWFYLFWAAVFLVSAIPRISWLKAFFETPFNQYLGRISFALYLVHGPVLWVLGDRLYAAVGWSRTVVQDNIPGWIDIFPLSASGPLGLELRFWIPHLVILPITLWLADIFTKLVDEPSVKFAQWLYRKAIGETTASILKA